jgi:hypothetical protein
MHGLFVQLSITNDAAVARMIALEIAAKFADVNGTSALALVDALMDAWWEQKRQREIERRNGQNDKRSHSPDKAAPSSPDPTPSSPPPFDPCDYY